MEQVDAALAKVDEIPKRAGKITYLERALILCLEGRRTTRDEALAASLRSPGQAHPGDDRRGDGQAPP